MTIDEAEDPKRRWIRARSFNCDCLPGELTLKLGQAAISPSRDDLRCRGRSFPDIEGALSEDPKCRPADEVGLDVERVVDRCVD